jgi:pyrroline-5-carboxylate reductase
MSPVPQVPQVPQVPHAARILLVGCGKMGGALLHGWLAGGTAPDDVVVVEPQPVPDSVRGAGAAIVADAHAVPAGFAPSVVVFAVKPQVMDEAVPPYRRHVASGATFLSIAAGRPIGYFEDVLGPGAGVVRAMPNTPAAIGCGITVACANANVPDSGRDSCDRLLRAVGDVAWIEDEGLMDAVTATSGSGPAYVFLLIESLAAAGVASGLPAPLAMQLARATVAGAGRLAGAADEAADVLRRNVTSPGGTTEAALKVLMADDGLEQLMIRAVDAATRRSRELAG